MALLRPRMMTMYHPRWLLVCLICIAMGVHIANALLGPLNFTSDQAVLGIDAREMLDGHFTLYQSGQRYNGSLYALLAAPFLALMGDSSVVALRMPYLIGLLLFFVVHALVVTRSFGIRVALLSQLFLALPHFALLKLGFFLHFNLHVLFTWLLLFAVLSGWRSQTRQWLYACVGGAISGIAYWYNPSFILVLLLVAVLLFFFLDLRQIPQYRATAFAFLGGYLLTNAPQWIGALLGKKQFLESNFSVPTFEHFSVWSTDIVPALFGIVPGLKTVNALSLLSLCIIVLLLILVAPFLYRRIERIIRREADASDMCVTFFAGLTLLFPIVSLFRSPAHIEHVRFMLICWPALTVLLALGCMRLLSFSRSMGTIVIIVFSVNMIWMNTSFTAKVYGANVYEQMQLQYRERLLQYLDSHGIEHVLGSYWSTVPLQYLHPDVTFAPFMGSNRFPDDFEQVMEADRFALLLRDWKVKAHVKTPEPLLVWFFEEARLRRNHEDAIKQKLQRSEIVDYRSIGKWHVLLFDEQ